MIQACLRVCSRFKKTTMSCNHNHNLKKAPIEWHVIVNPLNYGQIQTCIN